MPTKRSVINYPCRLKVQIKENVLIKGFGSESGSGLWDSVNVRFKLGFWLGLSFYYLLDIFVRLAVKTSRDEISWW